MIDNQLAVIVVQFIALFTVHNIKAGCSYRGFSRHFLDLALLSFVASNSYHCQLIIRLRLERSLLDVRDVKLPVCITVRDFVHRWPWAFISQQVDTGGEVVRSRRLKTLVN